MTNGSWVAVSALAGLMATSAAHAELLTIDADAYAPGADVSTVFDGVTLSHLTFTAAGIQSSDVYSAGCAAGAPVCNALGAASFGWQNAAGTTSANWSSSNSAIGNCLRQNYSYCYSSPQHLLDVSLAAATDFIAFDSTYLSDHPYVWALDAAGNILSVTIQRTYHATWGPNSPYGHQTVTVTSALGNISRIVIAGNGGASTVDGITYNAPAPSVPEPETLAMMMAGLLGAAVTARRRKE